MQKGNIIILLCVIGLASCKGQVKIRQAVLKDIRADTLNTWSCFHNVRQLSKQLKLEPVEDGFDSLQIRVWFDYSLARKKHLIIIEQRNKEWNGRLYEMSVGYIDTLNYNIVEHFDKKYIEPISGWQEFMSNLYRLKIRDLSDTSHSGTDGTTYCVEILTPDTYTYYDFWEPGYTKATNWQSENMVSIVALLEREFKFNSLKSR